MAEVALAVDQLNVEDKPLMTLDGLKLAAETLGARTVVIPAVLPVVPAGLTAATLQ